MQPAECFAVDDLGSIDQIDVERDQRQRDDIVEQERRAAKQQPVTNVR